MAPIPETRQIPTNLIERYTFPITNRLVETPKIIDEPPTHHVSLGGLLTVGVSKAFLLRGENPIVFGNFVRRNYYVPQDWKDTSENKHFLEKTFGITFANNEKDAVFTISRISNPALAVHITQKDIFKHKQFAQIQTAIIALAMLPDALWPQAAKGGLVVGNLVGDIYEPWKVDDVMALVPDPRGVLGWGKRLGLLPLGPELRDRVLDGDMTKMPARKRYVAGLPMVGVFADLRTASPKK